MFIVLYDDEGGIRCPYRIDPETLEMDTGEGATIFATRKQAQRAIRYNVKLYEAAVIAGELTNDDFSPEYRKFIRIEPVKMFGGFKDEQQKESK